MALAYNLNSFKEGKIGLKKPWLRAGAVSLYSTFSRYIHGYRDSFRQFLMPSMPQTGPSPPSKTQSFGMPRF